MKNRRKYMVALELCLGLGLLFGCKEVEKSRLKLKPGDVPRGRAAGDIAEEAGAEISYFPIVKKGKFTVFADSARDLRVEWNGLPVLSSFGSINLIRPYKNWRKDCPIFYTTPGYIPVTLKEVGETVELTWFYHHQETGFRQINKVSLSADTVVASCSFSLDRQIDCQTLRLLPCFLPGHQERLKAVTIIGADGKETRTEFLPAYVKSSHTLGDNFKGVVFDTDRGKVHCSVAFDK
ncbi:MAG: hypothetical protein FJY85_22400, partial [Deltaproteobacteria bacterium]|nr:hypothetical protein [Deltaproteobacteria bacterium]